MTLCHNWSPALRAELKDFNKFLKLMQVFDKNAAKMVPFDPTPEQLRLANLLIENKRVIILKARQIGASTIARAYFTWKALLSEEPIISGIMSLSHESASYLHSLDKGFVACLPKPLQRKLDASNGRSIRFKDTGAQLRSFTAGMKGGGTRSFALTDLHLSEFAHYDDQAEILSNAVSTVGAGGQIVIETTANGPGDEYHRLCIEAGNNGWALFFSPWFKHKAYRKQLQFGDQFKLTDEDRKVQSKLGLDVEQICWRREMIQTMGPDKFAQEYPSTVEEAFVAQTSAWLLPSHLSGIDVRKGGGKEICLVDPNEMNSDQLVLGVDVAAGIGADYTAVTAVSVSTGQPIWHWHCNDESPSRFSERLLGWCKKWQVKKVLIETNSVGGIVLQRLRDLGFDEKLLWKNNEGKDWTTSRHTKLRMLTELKSRLEDNLITVMSEKLYKELQYMINDNHSARHMKNSHDDLVVATALAYIALLDIPNMANRETREKLMDKWIKTQRVSKILDGDRLPWKRRQLNA